MCCQNHYARGRRGALLLSMEARALRCVGDHAVGACGCLDPLQAPTDGNDEVQDTEMHERTRGPSFGVVGHPKPNGVTRKIPYLAHQLSVFRNHRLVNLFAHHRIGW